MSTARPHPDASPLVRERPILFSGPMVRALLAGTKTQTRRLVKAHHFPPAFHQRSLAIGVKRALCELGQLPAPYGVPGDKLWARETWGYRGRAWTNVRPNERTYDIEYQADGAKRTFTSPAAPEPTGIPKQRERRPGQSVEDYYETTLGQYWKAWRPSIHMPRWACRLVLEVTKVQAQRLQDISEEDARAEGLSAWSKDGHLVKYGMADRDGLPGTDNTGWPWNEWDKDPRAAFAKLWDSINGDRAPWASNPWVWCVSFKPVSP